VALAAAHANAVTALAASIGNELPATAYDHILEPLQIMRRGLATTRAPAPPRDTTGARLELVTESTAIAVQHVDTEEAR